MAVIASDTFTVASDTTLASHVPDVGTSWVQEVLISTTSTMTCIAASDTLAGSVLDGDAGGVYTVRPSPSIATYDQQFTVKNLGTNAATPWWLIARYTDTSNYYGAGTFIGTNAADKKMYKMVAGTATELGSADTGLAANDVIKFEVRDGTKKLFQNGGEVFSTSDNSLTSAGSGGLGTGAAFVSSDDFPGTGGLRIDDYSLDEVSTGVSGTVGGVAEITGTSAGSPVAAGSVAGTVDVTGAATGTPVITGTSANDVAITSSITGGQGQAGTVAVTADIVSVITGAPVITGSVGAQTDIICLAAGPGGPGEEVPAGVLFQRPLLATVGRMMGI